MIVIDVCKVGYRQTKDSNFAVTFTLHPNDDDDELKKAVMGTKFRMQLVPLDDDGNPQDADLPTADSVAAPAPASRLVQQAGIACNDPVFRRFLQEHGMLAGNAEEAAVAVRLACLVQSRKEFAGGEAGARWESLWRQYQAWKLAPEVA